MRRSIAAVLVAVLAVPLPLLAQTTTARVDVVLVEVPVTVTDGSGQPVRGLTAADFELVDGREKRPITHFDTIDFAARAGAAPSLATPIPPAARRNFMLLFDLTNSAPSSVLRAREAASEFVSKMLRPGDKVAVGTVSSQSGFRLLAAFSTDRALALHAIETLGTPTYYQPRDPLLMTVSSLEKQIQFIGSGRGAAEYIAQLKRHIINLRRSSAGVGFQQLRRTMIDFTILGQTLDRVAGRKQVILLSEGFDPRILQGRGTDMSTFEAKEERVAIESGEIWKVDNEARFGNVSARGDVSSMTDALRRSDVVLHAIDIRGLRTDVDPLEGKETKVHTIESLMLLTQGTGGEVFRNTNDLASEFARMLASQDVTYILGFKAPSTTAGKFHELKVRVPRLKDVKVAHRVGYYEPSAATSALDRMLNASEIIMDRIPVSDLQFDVLAAPFVRAEGPAHVPVVLDIEGAGLAAGAQAGKVDAEVFVYAFDASESIRDFVYQKFALDPAAAGGKLASKGVKFYHALELEPGDYSLRTLVRTGGDRSGFRESLLHVPARGESYVAPPLFFDGASERVMVKAPDRIPSVDYPFAIGETSFIPAAMPRLHPDSSGQLALFTYHVAPESLKVRASMRDASGASLNAPLKLVGRTSVDAVGGMKLLFEVSAPNVPAGEYTLGVELMEQAGRSIAVELPVRTD